MDEPCAALGPEETRMVHDLVRTLKVQGVGIILISHDMPTCSRSATGGA